MAKWAEGEEIAVIHDGIIDKLTVSSVNEASGSAEITGELTGTLVNGTKAEQLSRSSIVSSLVL